MRLLSFVSFGGAAVVALLALGHGGMELASQAPKLAVLALSLGLLGMSERL